MLVNLKHNVMSRSNMQTDHTDHMLLFKVRSGQQVTYVFQMKRLIKTTHRVNKWIDTFYFLKPAAQLAMKGLILLDGFSAR